MSHVYCPECGFQNPVTANYCSKCGALLAKEEEKVSYRRRILHGKIDILRAELVNRLRKKREEGESVISGADVQALTDILMGKAVADSGRED